MKPDRHRTRTRLRPDERRAQLLDCALAAFAEHGVARATHSHVAERAQVSVSAVYSYFRTREDLVAAVLDEVANYLDRIFDECLRDELRPEEALMGLARRFARDALERPDLLKVWLDWSTGVGSPVWPRYLLVLDRLHDAITKVLTRGKRLKVLPAGLDARAAARTYVGGGHTVALMQFAGVAGREVDAMIAHLVRGVTGRGAARPAGSRASP